MYVTPQSVKITHNRLTDHLVKFRYFPSHHTPGLCHHATRDIKSCLIVENFGVKYINKDDADHLKFSLASLYKITSGWSVELYLVLTLKLNYKYQTCDIFMPRYVTNVLNKLEHANSHRPHHSPYPWQRPRYGTPSQLTSKPDQFAPLPEEQIINLQQKIGYLLLYAHTVDGTLLPDLGSLAST